MVPGSIPKIIFEGFCKEETIFDRIYVTPGQKYQILYQLLSGAGFVCLAFFLYLSPGKESTQSKTRLFRHKRSHLWRAELGVPGNSGPNAA